MSICERQGKLGCSNVQESAQTTQLLRRAGANHRYAWLATSSQNPASRQANTTPQVVCTPSRKHVQPPICSQSFWMFLAVCLNTSGFPAFVAARVPAAGLEVVSFFPQPDAIKTHTSVAESRRNMIFLAFGSLISSPSSKAGVIGFTSTRNGKRA